MATAKTIPALVLLLLLLLPASYVAINCVFAIACKCTKMEG